MASAWKPGYTRIPGNLKPAGFHRNVNGTLSIGTFQAIQYSGDPEEIHARVKNTSLGWAEEEGTATLLSLRFSSNNGLLLNLGFFREEELEAIRDFVNASIDRALPVVRERDRVAREAEANGDYSYARSNRAHPKLVGNPRPVEQHSEGVRDGHQDAVRGDAAD